jgi:hypothetical protein
MRTHASPIALLILVVALLLSGCTDDELPQNSADTTSVTGRERIAWDQVAPSLEAVRAYSFTVLIDGAHAVPLDASCASASGSNYTCSAPLPQLSPGAHVLALQTADRSGSKSSVSAGISIAVSSPVAASTRAIASDGVTALARVCLGTAGDCYELQRIASNLPSRVQPRTLTHDRILLIGDGRLLELSEGRPRPVSMDINPGTTVLDAAAAKDYSTTHEVYVLEARTNASSRTADLVRFRDVNGILGERAVIVPAIPIPSTGHPALMVDDEILVAVPRGGEQSQLGIVLRYRRGGESSGYRPGSPQLAWGPAQPTVLLKLGDSIAVAGVGSELVLGTLVSGVATPTPVSASLAYQLSAAGGVKAIARTQRLTLIATADGSLHLAGFSSDGHLSILQRLNTYGVLVTGLASTGDGKLVATAVGSLATADAYESLYQLIPLSHAVNTSGH